MKDKFLIFAPNDENYIEILGHRIDGFESFEAFCEHLKKYVELEETVKIQKAEIERLEDLNKCYYTSCQQTAKSNHEIKTEAVKEFAERLHEYINGIIERHEMPMFPFSVAFVSGMETKIDNLVKEMVGEG